MAGPFNGYAHLDPSTGLVVSSELPAVVTGTAVAGQVAFWNGVSSIGGDALFTWDNATKRLGVNSAPGTYALEIGGSQHMTGMVRIATPTLGLSAANEGSLSYDDSLQAFVVSENGGAYKQLLTVGSVSLQVAYIGGQTIGQNTDGIVITRSGAVPDTLPLLEIQNFVTASTQVGLVITNNNGSLASRLIFGNAVNNTVGSSLQLKRNVTGSPNGANGIGIAQEFVAPSDDGTARIAAKFSGGLSDVTTTAENGFLKTSVISSGALTEITSVTGVGFGIFNSTPSEALHVVGNARVDGRLLESKGANVASANDMTLGTDGNFFVITGATQINGIAVAGWTEGSKIQLFFTSNPLVKDAGSPGAGFGPLQLDGTADFSAVNGSILGLVFYNGNWEELYRKVP